jgi:hypothetical protein
MSEHFLENHDTWNRYKAMQGFRPQGCVRISKYVTYIKARKIIRALSEGEICDLNKLVFGERLSKFNKWTKEKLSAKLSIMQHPKLMRFLYVREKESLMDALLCLIEKKQFGYDQKFLTNYFKYGTALKQA